MVLTVVIPVLNELDNLRRLLLNLVPFREEVQLLFVDGYSSDGSYEYLLRSGYHVEQQYPEGIYSAYNYGIDLVKTKYCLFLGSDDRLLPGLINALDLISQRDFTMLICQSIIDPEGYTTKHSKQFSNLINSNFCHQSIIYNIEVIRRIKYDTRLKVMSDWHMNLRLLSSKKSQISYCDEAISVYSKGGFSALNRDGVWERNHYYYKVRYIPWNSLLMFLLKKYVQNIFDKFR